MKTVTKGTTSTAKANVDGTSKAAAAARTTGNRAGFTDAQKSMHSLTPVLSGVVKHLETNS